MANDPHSPFPGMDPYLEARWSDVHVTLLAFLAESLQSRLPPDLRARIEQAEAPADGSAPHRWVRVIDVKDAGRVVTVIELLKPEPPPDACRRRLDDYARAGVNVVEVDLLRASRHRLPVDRRDLPARGQVPYLISLRRGPTPGRWEVYPVVLQQPIPRVPVPLRETDADVPLDLQPLIERVYRAGGHDDIDYAVPAVPELEGPDAAWAAELLAQASLRPAAG